MSGSLFLHPCFDSKPYDGYDDKGDDDEFDVLGILADFVVELLFGYDGVQIPAQSCQYGVPAASTDSGIEQEFPRGSWGRFY